MKILASDLDGTLVHDGVIINENLQALKQLKECGNKFVICTGRSIHGVNKILNKYSLDYDYLVLCNGGLILDKDNNVLLDKWIKKDILEGIINDYQGAKDTLIYYDNSDETVLIENNNSNQEELDKIIDYFSRVTTIDEISELEDKYRIISVFGVDNNIERIEKIRKEIVNKYGKYVEVFRNKTSLDIVPRGCSKGNALMFLLELEKLQNNDLYVVGDSYNDISMFEKTRNSYTFNSSEENVKMNANNCIIHVFDVIKEII